MAITKTPPPLPIVPGGTTPSTTVPKAPTGTIIPQVPTPTTVPTPVKGTPPVTVPKSSTPTIPTITQKKGAPPLPVGTVPAIEENVPPVGQAGMAVPTTKTPPKYVTSPDLYEARRDLGQASIDALRAGVSVEEVERTVTGEEQKMPGGWRGALAKVINYDIIPGKMEFKPSSLVLGPLTTIDVGRRALVSGFRESVELAKDIRDGKQRYQATDYIPTHKQTGLPIAKPGDLVIDNWEEIINTPIPNIEKINTFEEAQTAQDKIVQDKATTTSGSLKDLVRQTRDITTGFGDIPYVQTGNKWVDRVIGLFGDVALDPTTYVGAPGALTRTGVQAGLRAGVRRTAVELAQDAAALAARDLAEKTAVREAAEAASREAADYAERLAIAGTESAVKTPIIAGTIPDATAIIREAEQRAALAAEAAARAAADEAAAVAAKEAADAAASTAGRGLTAAEEVVTQTQRQAPRRTYGAGAKETLANTVREIREEALAAATNEALPMVERVAARKAATVLSDDLISGIATKGYANITGEAAQLLGVRGGLRIGLPTFPKFTIPGTAPFTGLVGKAVAGRRLWFVNTPKGAALLNRFMGAPEGGILGEADILTLRKGLSQGTLKGAEAVDAVALLAADRINRAQLNFLRKEGVAIINGLKKEYPKFTKVVDKISPHLLTPEISWGAKGLKPLSGAEREIYDAYKQILDGTFGQAQKRLDALGAKGLTKVDNYFPRVQSAATLQWAGRNRRLADKVASDLGIDTLTLLSGNYLDRTLIPGKKWFGYTLTPADIAGGIPRLNQIAKQYGKVKFDFFTTNANEALAGYLNNHARFMAYTAAVLGLPKTPSVIPGIGTITTRGALGGTARGVPSAFDARYVPPDIINAIATRRASELPFARASRIATETKDLKAVQAALTDVETKVTALMRPDKLVNWSPEQIETAKILISTLGERLKGDVVIKQEIKTLANELENHIVNVTRAIDSGTVDPVVGGLLLDEAENLAIAVADDIAKVKTTFAGTPAERWAGVSEFARLGFESINPDNIPNTFVRQEVAGMLQNLKRLDDTKFARRTEVLFKDLTTFTKATVTGSIGFHVRNALGNTFMMLAAGGKPENLIQGLSIYRKIEKGLKEGQSIVDVIKALPPFEQQAVRDAVALSGATGFGQFGEIATAAGVGKTGITGRTATGLTPFAGRQIPFGGGRVIPGTQVPGAARASAAIYAPLRKLRDKGAAIEEATRFALLYDGIKQGLDPQEAANRVNKYMVDYANINAIDRNVRSIVPFWMWMSRNLPLQIENMWMAPGAYQKYLSFRRNMQDKEGESPFMPDYLKEQGAFKIPNLNAIEGGIFGGLAGAAIGGLTGGLPGAAIGGTAGALGGSAAIGLGGGESLYLNPQLGFPGAGAPNILQQAASGDVYEVLSGLTPALRVPLENEINKQLFSGAPITKENLSDKENSQRYRQYLYSQLLAPAGLIGRYLSAIPGDEPKWLQTLTGSKLDRELNTTLSLLGAPGFKLRSIEERNEIMRRYYLLQEKKNRALQNLEGPQE